jgi:short-subunit dehydrogenase
MTDKPISVPRVAIFGATSGIAAAVARHYAEAGARLVLVGRNNQELAETAADLKVRGAADVVVERADFAVTSQLQDVAATAWNTFDGLDIALVAYGNLPDQQAAEENSAFAEQTLVLNFLSPSLLCGELGRQFEAQRAGILAVISSVAGDRGRKSNYVYGAAKGGLQRYLEGLRHRLFGSGIQVLDIRPGFVSTKMTAHLDRRGSLWADPAHVAADIVMAIHKRRAVLYTPWFWRWIMLVVRNAPAPLFHRSSL